jgi:hypothetical protein
MAANAVMPVTDARSAGVEHAVGAIERAIRWALALGIAFQIAQRFAKTGYDLSEYGRSLWYVTYEFGFVRRGLAGEIVRGVLGATPSLRAVDLSQNLIALVMLAAATSLVVLLCRRRTVIAYATAGLLVFAPFSFDSVGGQRRPDLFGYLLLAAVGLWAASGRPRAITLAAVGGALLAGSALVSEASPLIVGPWLVLVVLAVARTCPRARGESGVVVTLCAVPSVVTLAVLTSAGRADSATVAVLEQSAPPEIRGHGTVFAYLGDTVRSSFERVMSRPNQWLSILVGGVFVALFLYCARDCAPYARAMLRWLLPTTLGRRAWISATVLAAGVLFALGFDWLRWITSIGFAALLASAAIVALDGRSRVGPQGRERWHVPVPSSLRVSTRGATTVVIATYLLVLAPLPNFIRDFGDAAQTLLSVPR